MDEDIEHQLEEDAENLENLEEEMIEDEYSESEGSYQVDQH